MHRLERGWWLHASGGAAAAAAAPKQQCWTAGDCAGQAHNRRKSRLKAHRSRRRRSRRGAAGRRARAACLRGDGHGRSMREPRERPPAQLSSAQLPLSPLLSSPLVPLTVEHVKVLLGAASMRGMRRARRAEMASAGHAAAALWHLLRQHTQPANRQATYSILASGTAATPPPARGTSGRGGRRRPRRPPRGPA